MYFAFDETARITRSKLMTDGGIVEAQGRCFAPRRLYAGHNASNKETPANAFTRFPMLLDRSFVAIVRVGKAGGGLDRSFHERQCNLKRELSKIKKVEAVVRNPTFVVVAMVLALVVSKTTLIPAFTSGFDRFGSDLPLLTRILMLVSDIIVY